MNITSIGIIGHGQFGAFLEMLAHSNLPHIPVRIFSRSAEIDNQRFFSLEAVCSSDIVILCVPISSFEETVKKCKSLFAPHTIVCDVATIKTHTLSVLEREHIPRFIATHPMFGPYSYAKHNNSLTNLRIAWCASNLKTEEQEACISMLEHSGLKVLELSAHDHDKLVAETLFLTHLVGQIVHRGGFERTSIDTVSFGFLMDAVESVRNDDNLFRDVFMHNPYCKKVLEQFIDAQKLVLEKLRQ